MIIVFQGLREGIGTTTLTVGTAFYWAKYREPVLAIDASTSPLGLSAHFNLPALDTGWNDHSHVVDEHLSIWQYRPGLFVLPKIDRDYHLVLEPSRVNQLFKLIERARFKDVLVDIGASQNSPWLTKADYIVTILSPDANAYARFAYHTNSPTNYFVVNGLHPGLDSDNDISSLFFTHPKLGKHLFNKPIPFDDYLRKSLAHGRLITEYYPNSSSVSALAGFATWLRIKTFQGSTNVE